MYKQYAEQLVKNSNAYYAFDTAEELDAKRKEITNFQYSQHTRNAMNNSLTLSEAATQQLLDDGKPYVIRIKMPENVDMHFTDMIRGEVSFNSSLVDYKVLLKADGMPTYHLAVVVDYSAMEITHAFRGEEWLPSSPVHVLLWQYLFGIENMPQWAHLPLILKPDGNGKLSKRDGDRLGFPVFPLEWRDPKTGDISSGYRESGYLPEAVINFLALLGWNPGNNQEVMSLDELVELFNIEKCSKSGAKFDYEKGKYFNHLYLQKKSDAELAKIVQAKLDELNIIANSEKVEMAVAAMKERATFTNDLWDLCAFFFVAPTTFNEKDVQKRWKTDTSTLLSDLLSKLETMDSFDDAEKTEEEVKTWCETKGYGLGSVMNPFRLTLVGEMKGPQMFLITKILGKDEVVKRLKYALITING